MKSMIRSVVENENRDDELHYNALMFCCPGCASTDGNTGLHLLPVNSTQKQPSWDFTGDTELPDLSPSILTRDGRGGICHSFLRNGIFEFLSDSTHALAGMHVPIGDLPDWVTKRTEE